jgi:hypothetical protein
MPRRRSIPAAVARALALAVLLSVLPGCAGVGFLTTMASGGEQVPAKYELARRPTLVLVDDPQQLLGRPAMARQVAANARFHLREQSALSKALLVPGDRLMRVRRELGADYPSTPIAAVGRRTDAEQVIHVLVRSASLQYGGPVYRPRATVEVKVVEAKGGDRLFPKGQSEIEGLSPRGYPVRSVLDARHTEGGDRTNPVMMRRELARRVGRDVARLFYAHRANPIADQLDEHD